MPPFSEGVTIDLPGVLLSTLESRAIPEKNNKISSINDMVSYHW